MDYKLEYKSQNQEYLWKYSNDIIQNDTNCGVAIANSNMTQPDLTKSPYKRDQRQHAWLFVRLKTIQLVTELATKFCFKMSLRHKDNDDNLGSL